MFFPRPRSPLKIWSRETGSAGSFFALSTNLVLTHTGLFPLSVKSFICNVNYHWINPEFIASDIGVPMASTAESPLAQGQ